MNLSDSAFARPRGRTTGAATRLAHLVVVQLLFSEDGLLVPHGGRGVVSRPFERRFPSAASGAPSAAPAALASLAAGSVASLAWPAWLSPAVQWEGRGGWEARRGLGGGGSRVRAGPEAWRGRRSAWREGGGALGQSRRSREVTSPRGQSVYATAVHWDDQAVASEGCLTPDHPALLTGRVMPENSVGRKIPWSSVIELAQSWGL